MGESDNDPNNKGGSNNRSNNDNDNDNANGSDGNSSNGDNTGQCQGGNRSNNKNANDGDNKSHSSTSFKGANEKLKGHMFRHGRSENRCKHHKTIKAIVQHVAEECNRSKDTKKLIEKMKHITMSLPTNAGSWDAATTNQRLMQNKLVDNL